MVMKIINHLGAINRYLIIERTFVNKIICSQIKLDGRILRLEKRK